MSKCRCKKSKRCLSIELRKKIQRFCQSERKKRKVLCYNYGTVCIGVEDSKQIFQKCSCSFQCSIEYYSNSSLRAKLSKLGIIGKTTNDNCVLGYCAEPHAAELLLRRLNSNKVNLIQNNTDKFFFTEALRVRTNQSVKNCIFCKKTFPQL